jgi:chitinase
MAFDLGWDPTANMPWSDLTQVYLFNLATENGPGLDDSNVRDIDVPAWVAAAHAHRVETFISIGGDGDNTWGNACNDSNRAQFVQNLVGYATSNGFDGIDLDIEDGPWSQMTPPVAAMTTCIEAISNAAHPHGLLVSADEVTNWQGPWYAPSQSYVDQFNLMTYGDNLATMQSDVADTSSQGLPASKFVVGIDIIDYPDPPPGGCGQFSRYAAQAGLRGAFVWAAQPDTGNVCLNGLAGG